MKNLLRLSAFAGAIPLTIAAASVCPVQLASPAPAGNRCGTSKVPTGQRAAKAMIDSATGYTQDGCAEWCFDTAGCKAFAWDSSDGTCSLYKRKGSAPLHLTGPASTAKFWNKNCYERPATCASKPFFVATADHSLVVNFDNSDPLYTTAGLQVIYASTYPIFHLAADGSWVSEGLPATSDGQLRQAFKTDEGTVDFPYSLDLEDDYDPLKCAIDADTSEFTCQGSDGVARSLMTCNEGGFAIDVNFPTEEMFCTDAQFYALFVDGS